MIILSVMLMVVLSIAQVTVKGSADTNRSGQVDQALYVDEGSLNDLLVRLKRDASLGSGYSDTVTIDGVEVERQITDNGLTKTLSARATYQHVIVLLEGTYTVATKAFVYSRVAP
jgi:nitrogen fixation protein FixH